MSPSASGSLCQQILEGTPLLEARAVADARDVAARFGQGEAS